MFQGKELKTSALCGLIFGAITYFICIFSLPEEALIMGLITYLISTVMLWIYFNIIQKRYAQLEKEILSPVFHKANGNFDLGNKVINGNIYFCETVILFASLEEKPYRVQELQVSQILKYEVDNVHLNIYTKDNQVFVITIPNAKEIIDKIQEKGWIQ